MKQVEYLISILNHQERQNAANAKREPSIYMLAQFGPSNRIMLGSNPELQ